MAVPAFGTLMQIGDGAGTESFTTIAEVKDITPPQFSRETIDVTNHSSPGGWEEVIASIKRSGNVSFDCNWIPNSPTHDFASGLGADFQSGVNRHWRIVFPAAAGITWTFSGFITAFNPAAPVLGVLGLSITIKVTGQPVLT